MNPNEFILSDVRDNHFRAADAGLNRAAYDLHKLRVCVEAGDSEGAAEYEAAINAKHDLIELHLNAAAKRLDQAT
jgi:hypothetical protein